MDTKPLSNPQFPQPEQVPSETLPSNYPVNSFQQPVNQPAPMPQPPQVPIANKDNRWVKWLVLWLAAIPLALVLTFSSTILLRSNNPDELKGTTTSGLECTGDICSSDQLADDLIIEESPRSGKEAAGDVVNIVAVLLGIYGILGWIPLVISLSRRGKQTA